MEEIRLSVPAQGEYVPVLRSVVAAVAGQMDIPYDEIDDLRLAIDEAAVHLIGLEPPGRSLDLKMSVQDDRFEAGISVDSIPMAWPPADVTATLSGQILAGLTDETSFDRAGDRAQIRFVKRIKRVDA